MENFWKNIPLPMRREYSRRAPGVVLTELSAGEVIAAATVVGTKGGTRNGERHCAKPWTGCVTPSTHHSGGRGRSFSRTRGLQGTAILTLSWTVLRRAFSVFWTPMAR